MSKLLDPAIVLPSRKDDPVLLLQFWLRLITWEAEGSAVLGWRTYSEFLMFYSHEISDGWIPPGLGSSVHRTAQKLLSKPLSEHGVVSSASVVRPPHGASLVAQSALTDDLVGHAPTVVALATDPEFWPVGSGYVECVPPPPALIPLWLDSTLPTRADALAALARKLSGRPFAIVGGQKTDRVIQTLADDLLIGPSTITWHESEKGKPPRNLDRLVAGAASSGTIVICITGKIGHSESILLRDGCAKKGVDYVWVESPTDIVDALMNSFM